MHEGDNAIDRTAVDGRQIAGDDRRIDSVDRRARRHWQTVGAIGIGQQGIADAVDLANTQFFPIIKGTVGTGCQGILV